MQTHINLPKILTNQTVVFSDNVWRENFKVLLNQFVSYKKAVKFLKK